MTFFDEMILAARGVFAIAIGRRDGGKYFSLTLLGLSGAAIALILSFAISIFVPEILGVRNNGLLPFQALIFIGVVSLFQVGAAAIILYLLNRFDGFVPYLVVDFWSTFFITILTLLPVVFRLQSEFLMLVLAILVLVIKINVLRLIVKLPVMHIILFFVAIILIGFFGLITVSSLLGVDMVELNKL